MAYWHIDSVGVDLILKVRLLIICFTGQLESTQVVSNTKFKRMILLPIVCGYQLNFSCSKVHWICQVLTLVIFFAVYMHS